MEVDTAVRDSPAPDISIGETRPGGHCTLCGRPLELVTEKTGMFDTETGEAVFRTYNQCPRFPRSWRNAFLGGIGHDSLYGTMGAREWR